MKNGALKSLGILLPFLVTGIISCGDPGVEKRDHEHETGPAEKHGTETLSLDGRMVARLGLTFHVTRLDTVDEEIVAPAKILLNQDLQAHVGSFLPGRVSRVFVKPGDAVRKGDILFHIEGLDIGEIKAEYIKTRASLTLAERVLERQRTLVDQNVVSRKNLDEAQAGYDKALAEFNAVDRKIHSIGLDDADVERFVDPSSEKSEAHIGGILPVRSPIDGIVAERNIVLGQLVDQTTTALAIVNTTRLWCDAQIQEADLPYVDRRTAVHLSVSAYPGDWFNGSIINVGETVDPATRTVTVRAEISNSTRRLKPGMFAEMHVARIGGAPSISVPAESIVKDDGETYLFVAVSDSLFEKRIVQTGADRGESVEILGGLKHGERVVVKGSFLLKSELKKESFAGEDH